MISTANRIPKVRDSLRTARAAGLPVTQIVDVGIQDGTPPLIEIFPDLHHHLFEPVEEFYPAIHESYAGLSYDLVPAAVSDTDGELLLRTEKKTRNDAISHSYLVQGGDGENVRRIQSLRLDTHFAQRPPAGETLLKIDVEGADVPARILRGARGLLSRCSMVMMEMTVDTFLDRAAILHEAGFAVWDICDLCYYGGSLWQADVLFVREDVKRAIPALHPMHQRPFRSELWQSGF